MLKIKNRVPGNGKNMFKGPGVRGSRVPLKTGDTGQRVKRSWRDGGGQIHTALWAMFSNIL